MKTKALGFMAFAAAFMASTVQAYDGVGDIRSIDPCDVLGTVVEPRTLENPYVPGETAYFRIRLENVNSDITWAKKPEASYSNPWSPKYTGVMAPELAWVAAPPVVGVYVSGKLHAAKVLSLAAPEGKGWYTDVICAYTVQPGDMAFPMTLANSAGKEVGTGSGATYYFGTFPASSSTWTLVADERQDADNWSTIVGTHVCTFAFGDSTVFNTGATIEEWGSWTADNNLRKAGLYLKSVDFAASEYTVPEGRTERVQVDIVGGANTNGIGLVYAMVKDGGAVSLAEGSVDTFSFTNTGTDHSMDGTYQVASVTIPSGADVTSFSFKVLGNTEGGQSTVYLTTTKGFTFGGSGNLVTNFLTAVVKCVEAPPPYVTVTLDGSATKSVASSPNYTDYAVKMRIELSEAYTNDFTFTVPPTFLADTSVNPFGKYIGVSTFSENGYGESVTSVSFSLAEMEAGTLYKDLYVYVLGADDDTDGIGKGIKFTPVLTGDAATFFGAGSQSATLYIKRCTPVISYPAEGATISGLAGGVDSAFSFRIDDDYTNLQSPYTVEWLKTGSGSPLSKTATLNSDRESSIAVKYNAGTYATKFRVKNAAGMWSDYRTINVQVNEAKQVSAVVDDPDDSGSYDESVEELTVSFKLTEAYDEGTIYAFLVPLDEASSNLVTCKAFTQGIAIKGGDLTSQGSTKIQILDGNDDTLPLSYSIMLRTAKTLTGGEQIGTYESKDLELYINNVAPTVASLNMSGSLPVTESGGTFAGKASVGLQKVFTVDGNDVEADLTNIVTSVWTFSDPNGFATTKEIKKPLAEVSLTNTFAVAGRYTITVKLQDKDMGKTKFGATFTAYVDVLAKPAISFEFPDSSTFDETAADKGTSMFYLNLSTPASATLDVLLTTTKVSTDGEMVLATNHVYFTAGTLRMPVAISDLDGTANTLSFRGGFSVEAKVNNPATDKNEDGIAWSDVYLPATEKIFVRNEPPVIILPVDYGITNTASVNVDMPIKWKVSDVMPDMTNGLTVTWITSEGLSKEFTGDVAEGVFTNRFSSGGTKAVTITVTDKDDGMATVTLYYRVAPSKRVNAYAQGPYTGGGLSALSQKYASAKGKGAGRLWSTGGSLLVEDFVHKLTFGKTASSAPLYAWGYKAGQIDNGTLVDSTGRSGRDVAISKLGDSFASSFTDGDCYSYADNRDSFFYAWVIDSKEDEATAYTGVAQISPKLGDTHSYYNLSLPSEEQGDDNSPYYADRDIEAFFAREYYPEDNMGDMNADGIPDYYAMLPYTLLDGTVVSVVQAMTGVSSSSGGDEGDASASDLADVSGYNGDGDFFPEAWTSVNPLNPKIKGWGPGQAFTTRYEVRGVHEGLNEPGISEYSLSVAETYALFADCAAAGVKLTNSTHAANYVVATNWAHSTGWTPDIRLSPTLADSDFDGFDDGWEYFFWYYAKCGAVTNGVWARLEGRRFNLSDPGKGVRIPSSEIVAAFDPRVGRGRESFEIDFDNDGLTDFEEYVLGTNPIDWDSDGDGINDLWEVMNGLDPLSPTDGALNPDGDFMAKAEHPGDTFTVFTFANGEMFGLPSQTSPNFIADRVAETTNGYKVVTFDGVDTNIWFAVEAPANDGTALTADVDCFAAMTSGDGTYLTGLAVTTLTNGTAILSAATAPEDVSVFSGYYEVKIIVDDAKTEKAWFAAPPAVMTMPKGGKNVMYLAADTDGFETFKHTALDKSVTEYLGAARTFTAGTPVASVSDVPVNMNQVYTEKYEMTMAGPVGGLSWIDPRTLERSSTSQATPLFNYGGDGVTYVPCGTNAAHYSLAPVVEDSDKKLARSAVVKVELKHKITLLHKQVFNTFGFDPRTAWNIDDYGYVDMRWRKLESEESDSEVGKAGLAVNTVPYTSRDEYLLMQYRQQMRKIGSDGIRSATESLLNGEYASSYLVPAGETYPTVDYFRTASTYPNLPVSFVKERYASRSEVNPFDNTTNRTIVAYWTYLESEEDIHGADTDKDGIPDGWELYVDADPTYYFDGTLRDGWAKDGDGLSVLEEYAGVDSCNAYTNRFNLSGVKIYPEAETITIHHPGKDSGWWNKFFPTNPYDRDTDGDGVMDDYEGKGWSAPFYVGATYYNAQKFTFIYATDEQQQKYAEDGTSTCFRGGGLNPCAVDTDGDLLPDAWEYQFAGIVFKDGKTDVALNDADLATLKAADGKQSACPETGNVIRGGMDGTWKGDPCLDFDHDGLLNCQEYLVQSLRHLRYDDPHTPLMGIDPTTKKFVKFVPFLAWDGEAFHKKCLASGFTGLGTWQFRELGYFARPQHEWDPLYSNSTGLDKCKNYEGSEGAGYRIMLPPWGFYQTGAVLWYKNGAAQYATTDPRRADSDEDGMDDYWELFHGLNPLLGSAAYPAGNGEYNWPNLRFDIIANIHNNKVNAWQNFWTGWPVDLVQPAFDPIRFPWMMGTMECDADGDGLRNDEEALKVNLANPRNTHTDPTPLWMTDSTSVDSASYTAQYYSFDPYLTEVPGYDPLVTYPDVLGYPWPDLQWNVRLAAPGLVGANSTWMFPFEENEGYDTDHDFRRDSIELTKGVEMASDPQTFSDPDCRQALYFPGLVGGVGSAAATRDGEFRRAVGTEPDLLKQFTVEFWAKPDGAVSNAVMVERVCNYGPSTLSNNTYAIRANFRVGVDEIGCPYGEFEGSTVDSGRVRVTWLKQLPASEWTHLAFTYDGATASLYVNGNVAPVAAVNGAGLIPANGIDGIQQEAYTSVIPLTGYRALPCATVLGADALNSNAVSITKATVWSDFGSFYKGWIDEVRIWDGARTPEQLHGDYMKRYSMDDVKALRKSSDDVAAQLRTGVYDKWLGGATRANGDLPAELLQHYNFVSLPGGVDEVNVLTAPPGFKQAVMDNVRKPNGKSLDESLVAGWWHSATGVHSTVYWDYRVIPWIGNTVAHLPFLDGSSPDSQYWSSGLCGVLTPSSQGLSSYDYSNAANPYPYYFYHRERYNRLLLLEAVQSGTNSTSTATNTLVSASGRDTLMSRWQFQLRSDFVGTSDLVPLGGAYAKRDVDFWDGQGAMDAWTETSKAGETADRDADGIPNWVEAIGTTLLPDWATTDFESKVQAYLRALANGLLPNGTYSAPYKDVSDVNLDGVPDWWQKMFGLVDSAQTDTDKDGLADFAEYLASELFFTNSVLSPVLPKSNGKEFDYFRKAGKLYLGEMFSDHDFMEDHFERDWSDVGADPTVYDAHLDSDGDGWSNFAEIRAKFDMGIGVNELGGHTNVITYTGPDSGRWTYVSYKNLLESLLDNASGCVVLDTDFQIEGRTSTANLGTDEGFWGYGYITYTKATASYGETWAYRGVPQPKVRMTVRYNGVKDLIGAKLVVSAYSDPGLKDADAVFTLENGNDRKENIIEFQYADKGYLREGGNSFVVFADVDEDGVYSFGEPFAIVHNVDVGWSGVKFVANLRDDDLLIYPSSDGVVMSPDIYVYRTVIDGISGNSYGTIQNPLVLHRNIGERTFLHLGDFLGESDFDVDWSAFTTDVMTSPMVANGRMSVTSVAYRVFFTPQNQPNDYMATNYYEFVRTFTPTQLIAVACEDSGVMYGARPVFRWRFDGPGADTFTAFSIVVKDASGTPVWNSGAVSMPLSGADGIYEWEAPLSVNDQTPLGKVFTNTNNYTWAISLHNAKFQSAAWSSDRTFRMNVYADSEPNNTARYSLNAKVKYFGPGSFDVNPANPVGILRVEAYASPDFSGTPAARTFVRDFDSVTNSAHEVNATFIGLKAGKYYVRAFIDSDGDFKRSAWESWGYACPRGNTEDPCAIYAPTSFKVGDGVETPEALVYVEDTDVDQDCLPDVWEYDNAGASKTDFLNRVGPMSNVHNGYIAVNPDIETSVSKLTKGGTKVALLSASPGLMPSALAALMLGVDSVEPSITDGSLAITSLSLSDGVVTLTLGADAEDPAAGTAVVSDGMVRVTVVVKYADALGGEWNSVEKYIEKKIEDGTVSETLSFSLSDLGLDPSKGFFKVEVKK